MFLNGAMEGQTPLTIDVIAVGSYMLRIEKKDYIPVTQEIIINDGEVTELHIKLERSD